MWGGQQEPNYEQSPMFGSMAGQHQELIQPSLSLVGCRGRCGALIDQIQFLFVDINTGQYIETPRWGGQGGGEFEFQAPAGQWIDHIHVSHGEHVNSIKLITNQGMESQSFGGNGPNQRDYDVRGKRITGIKCRCGGLVDAVTFMSI